MVEQSTLLQIIQFVGLITPALAILIELLVRFHGGLEDISSQRDMPFEIQALFIGFSALLIGGVIIGIQLGQTLENRVTQIATLFIFGSLPFLAIAVLVMNIRISGIEESTNSLTKQTISSVKYSTSILFPLFLGALLFFYPIYHAESSLNSQLEWWIFSDSIKPAWYFYATAGILTYKLMYSLWVHNIIPDDDYGNIIGQWFVVSFTLTTLYLLVAGIPFAIYYGLLMLDLPLITTQSLASAIPFLWGVVVVFATLAGEIDPN